LEKHVRKNLISSIISIVIGIAIAKFFGIYFFSAVLDEGFDFSEEWTWVIVDLTVFLLGLAIIGFGILSFMRRNKIPTK